MRWGVVVVGGGVAERETGDDWLEEGRSGKKRRGVWKGLMQKERNKRRTRE